MKLFHQITCLLCAFTLLTVAAGPSRAQDKNKVLSPDDEKLLDRLMRDFLFDPTGAGDSFAGGFFGYLDSQKEITLENFKRAMFYGGVMGSFAVQRFGTEQMQSLTREEIDQRFARFRELSHID